MSRVLLTENKGKGGLPKAGGGRHEAGHFVVTKEDTKGTIGITKYKVS